jgi:peptidoglycan/xylan/chitin deacetylase (PgdA/CDA1 family)
MVLSPAMAPIATLRLERLLQPLEQVPLDSRSGVDDVPLWLHAGAWQLLARPRSTEGRTGNVIETFRLDADAFVEALRLEDGTVFVPFDLDEAYGNYVTEAWREKARLHQLSTRQLGVYQRVKPLLPRAFWLQMRRIFIRAGGVPGFPAWPLELGVDRLLRFYALCLLTALGRDDGQFAWFWPGHYHAAVILTHDVESGPGLRLALELADLEEERGFRSSFNVVAAQYDIDLGILRELVDRGFEIGLHGLRHDRSLFSSRAEFERQLPELAEASRRLGAVGFRAPATYRVLDWLPELPVTYDCTVPHSDPYEPQPGGCCSLWPYMLDRLVELPYTLPQDHTLFTLLRERSPRRWLQLADAIEERFGLIQCLSHPDRGYLGDPAKRAFYTEFLDDLAGREGLWKALPRDVAAWWRLRDAGEARSPQQLIGTMRRAAGPEYACFEPPAASPSEVGITQAPPDP